MTPFNLQMAAALLASIPTLVVYILMGRYFMRGLMAESTQGLTWPRSASRPHEARYPNGFEAVKRLSLEIPEGELLVLVGPSGCGKTTALRMIAGLEDISAGDLYIGGRRMNDIPREGRDIAMVFQNYALYPHMTVAQNIGFSLKLEAPEGRSGNACTERPVCSRSRGCSTGGRRSN